MFNLLYTIELCSNNFKDNHSLPNHTNHIPTNTCLWPNAAEIYKRNSRHRL